MESLWTKTVALPDFPTLKENIKTDVLIIGGGLTGILCAYFLKQAGTKAVLVEGNRICNGVTKNTTAKITAQHRLIYDKLIKDVGTEKAQLYLQANQEALKKYEELCEGGKCGFEKKDSYVYSLKSPVKIEKEIEALRKLGTHAEFKSAIELPFSIAGSICLPKQAQFHPLEFVKMIVKDLNIYENTSVQELNQNVAKTKQAEIRADKIIVATHFPFWNKHGSYFMKLYQDRSYVIGLKNAAQLNGMYIDEESKGLSFRNAEDLLLLGGGSHRTGKKGGNWNELSVFAKKNYPRSEEEYRWATQDCMPLDSIPYIGKYSKNLENVFVASGFNKWGMTNAMIAGILLCDMINEKENKWIELFNPSRSIIKPQLAANIWESSINFLTPATKRCPHLGCVLKWNPIENTWDCPCHGSRFDDKGKLLDNPAINNMNIPKISKD